MIAADLALQGGKLACLFPGQGSQYIGMLEDLALEYSVVMQTFLEAEAVLTPLWKRSFLAIVWPDQRQLSPKDLQQAADVLKQTTYCQAALLTADVAMWRLFHCYGLRPFALVGHSLGEYAAHVAAGRLVFEDALRAVHVRGQAIADLPLEDRGQMLAITANSRDVAAFLKTIKGYVTIANHNSHKQTVIAGESSAIEEVLQCCQTLGLCAQRLGVSHAFHSHLIAQAQAPLRSCLEDLTFQPASMPILSNVQARPYNDDKEDVVSLLSEQLISPVQFVLQITKLYEAGCKFFVELGPKRVLTTLVRNILADKPHLALYSNHASTKTSHHETQTFLDMLAQLSGHGFRISPQSSLWYKENYHARN